MYYSWPGSTTETYFVPYNSLMLNSSDLISRVSRLADPQVAGEFIIIVLIDLFSGLDHQCFSY